MKRFNFWQDALIAGSCAAILNSIPSTVYAWLTAGDAMISKA